MPLNLLYLAKGFAHKKHQYQDDSGQEILRNNINDHFIYKTRLETKTMHLLQQITDPPLKVIQLGTDIVGKSFMGFVPLTETYPDTG